MPEKREKEFSRYEKGEDRRNHESFISITYRHNQMWRAAMREKKKKKHGHLALVLANTGRSIAETFRKRGVEARSLEARSLEARETSATA